ncbi:MAG: hypothetical protein JWO31_448, partial [Phycisphaerales bacterium]|nr:hypothetical protein [Phycisphaerales bacterium]
MPDQVQQQILDLLESDAYRPLKPRALARELAMDADDDDYFDFRDALADLVDAKQAVIGPNGTVEPFGYANRRNRPPVQ